jgi:CrcB protein
VEPALLIGIGGAAGSLIRYEISKLRAFRGIPLGTLAVNILGSFAFSLIVFSHAPDDMLFLVGTGGLGGFTTFSTFSYETFRLLENHDYYMMGVNILSNAGGSIIAVFLGYCIITM